MIVNGILIPPANVGDELEPGEPGYQAPTSADSGVITGYLTAEQKSTLREAARLESCARQQLAFLDAANRMSAAGGKLGRDLVELAATGSIFTAKLERSMLEIESAAAKLLVAMQELRYQIGGIPERDVIGQVLHDVDFYIANKQRALEFHERTSHAENHDKETI